MPSAQPAEPSSLRPLRRHLLGSIVLLWFVLWLNSGTLAPYAGTLNVPVVDEACGYLFNWDHDHHIAQFKMLEGAPQEEWGFCVHLRRVLYPLFSIALMENLGFNWGGLIANFLIYALTLMGLAHYLQRHIGMHAAKAGLWLLATYPGVAYYGGLPYSYTLLVPGFLAGFLLLEAISRAEQWKDAMRYTLLMGIMFTGYDHYAFFIPATGLVLLLRRKWFWIPPAVALMALPLVIVVLILIHGFHADLFKVNHYADVVNAYLHGGDLQVWIWYLKQLPMVFMDNVLFSSFLFFPLGFIACWILNRRGPRIRITRAEGCLIFVVGLLWAFNNLAPPYEGFKGWQVRGYWIARIYQPLSAVLLVYICRFYQASMDKSATLQHTAQVVVAIVLMGNLLTAFSGILGFRPGHMVLNMYYKHAERTQEMFTPRRYVEYMSNRYYAENLKTYGKRPVGFCRENASR
jgi:hypothetical protein